jgi:uncharacterized membrane protein YidH (DUF202 family)
MSFNDHAFAVFEEISLFDRETLRRFRQEILEPSGSRHYMEMWLAFRGREPDIQPLLEKLGLQTLEGQRGSAPSSGAHQEGGRAVTEPQSSDRLHREIVSQTRLALIRTNMAMDRTILAVVRTGLALIGSGVAIQELLTFRFQEVISVLLYGVGIVMVIVGLIRHLKARRTLRAFGGTEVLRIDRQFSSSSED